MNEKKYYVGTCGACFRTQRVKDNMMVLHGYQRPGDGMAHGHCFGAYATPYQLSKQVSEDYLLFLKRELENAQLARSKYPVSPEYRDDPSAWKSWYDQYARINTAINTAINKLTCEIAMVAERIETWALGTLTEASQLPKQAKTTHKCKLCNFELHGSYTDQSLLDGIHFHCNRCDCYNLITELDMNTIKSENYTSRDLTHSKAGRLKLSKKERETIIKKLKDINNET